MEIAQSSIDYANLCIIKKSCKYVIFQIWFLIHFVLVLYDSPRLNQIARFTVFDAIIKSLLSVWKRLKRIQ